MRSLALVPFCLAALAAHRSPAQEPAATDPAWQPHRAIRVLYAGWPGGSRERAFDGFLRQWFDQVGICDLAALTAEKAQDFDVVIADWCSQYGNDGYPKRESSLFTAPVQLGPEFTKPVLAMDYVSSQLRRGFKLDWL
jgi:hypothetical protein